VGDGAWGRDVPFLIGVGSGEGAMRESVFHGSLTGGGVDNINGGRFNPQPTDSSHPVDHCFRLLCMRHCLMLPLPKISSR